ncbi:MAG TPA: DUF2520 domain-containing protein [Thermoanaerobaculia bacterium]|nr:DUF2520 domain-containing protein [Thermoanaerobaculia bacterium]
MILGIIGGGRAAWAFGSTWRRVGWPIAGVTLRDGSTSPIASLLQTRTLSLDELANESELILIAVADAAIADFAQRIPPTNAVIFHPSGSMTSVRGGFSLHPLRALPPLGTESDLRDTLLVFEGAHRDIAQRIAEAAGARLAEIDPRMKPLYHAGAVFGANYVAALLDVAEKLLAEAGVENARQDLVALTRSAVDNWARTTGPERFTGPAARGDAAVIEQHLRALASWPELTELYRLLAESIVAARK